MLKLVDHTTGQRIVDDVVLDVVDQGDGRPLLLLHGAEGRPANREFIDLLAQQYRVIAPSHPGFDLSPRPDWCDTVDDLSLLYSRWIADLGLEDVVVVGLQFGGWIAAEMATRSAGRIAHLVLVDPLGIKVGGREDRDIVDVFATSHGVLDELIYHRPEFRDLAAASEDEERALRLARNEEALVYFGWQPYMHNPKLRRRLGAVTLPALVVWGEFDGIVSADYGRAYASSMPHATFELVPGAGHRPQVEDARTVAGLVRRFCDGEESPATAVRSTSEVTS